MTFIVTALLCKQISCAVVGWHAVNAPPMYCAAGFWQLDMQRHADAAALLAQGFTVMRADCTEEAKA